MSLKDYNPVVIIACVGYADYLAVTLPYTTKWSDTIFVVTSPTDDETKALVAEYPGVHCHETNAFTRDNAAFNKAAAVREAQEIVHAAYPRRWIVLLDADIVADPMVTRSEFVSPRELYSIVREDYATPEMYASGAKGVVYPHTFAGYFQMYYDKTKLYPKSSHNASQCDDVFRDLFPSRCRWFLDGTVAHLGEHSVNWNGRVSPRWPS